MNSQPGMEKVVALLRSRLTALGHWPDAAEVERVALRIHRSMGARTRWFHSRRHAVAMTEGADPIAALAALFHDTVYVQVDLGLPPAYEELLSRFVVRDGVGYRVADSPPGFLASLFGLEPGASLSPYGGLNEYLSAAAAVTELQDMLTPLELVEVVCCIEGTIPFRSNKPFERLAERLRKMAFSEPQVRQAVERAVWVAQKDVENFADPDCGVFLDNTWLLLPETNPALLVPDVYTVKDYRVALHKMEGFLSGLSAERVFHRFGNYPTDSEYLGLLSAAAQNIQTAVRYLRAKLAASAVLEALAEQTGGDAPISMFMGARSGKRRLEAWLPVVDAAEDCDPVVLKLLDEGRPKATSFDIRRAPLASYIYRSLGEAAVERAAAEAKRMFKGELGPAEFLRGLPGPVVEAVAGGLERTVATREPMLRRRPWALRA
ncbi:MAG: hypothetical protein HY553_19960 [Elusimicrobia bacterium]|nr:hypothetical protein [Elusimicrobiota bacterium]